MMRPGSLPLGQIIALDILVPPIGTCLWWLMARGWAASVQGGNVSETTKKREKWGFWLVLSAAYLLMFGITIYAYLT
jgi:hypothetical protein